MGIWLYNKIKINTIFYNLIIINLKNNKILKIQQNIQIKVKVKLIFLNRMQIIIKINRLNLIFNKNSKMRINKKKMFIEI